jgi:uncharacterized protein (DUF342 family)
MNDETLQTREQIAVTYLQHMQELAFEISVAMDAIAANALPRFQESVAKQEMLCATLAKAANAVNNVSSSKEKPFPPGGGTEVELKIRTTSAAIRELNLQYAALLKHSGRSIAILASLCTSHTGRFQEARGPRLKHQTWSCEM